MRSTATTHDSVKILKPRSPETNDVRDFFFFFPSPSFFSFHHGHFWVSSLPSFCLFHRHSLCSIPLWLFFFFFFLHRSQRLSLHRQNMAGSFFPLLFFLFINVRVGSHLCFCFSCWRIWSWVGGLWRRRWSDFSALLAEPLEESAAAAFLSLCLRWLLGSTPNLLLPFPNVLLALF